MQSLQRTFAFKLDTTDAMLITLTNYTAPSNCWRQRTRSAFCKKNAFSTATI